METARQDSDTRHFDEKQVGQFHFFSKIRKLLSRLHEARPHPNRQLHYDEHIALLLLSFFNPTLNSLRDIQRASALKKVQKALGVKRASLGSLSEASAVFDYRLLQNIFEELAEQGGASQALPRPKGVPDGLRILAADGSLWDALPRMAWALWQSPVKRGVKGHVQFDVIKHVPVRLDITNGKTDERKMFQQHIQPHSLNLIDRGFTKFELFQDILDAGSSFVARVKNELVHTVAEERALTENDRKAGVLSDRIAAFTSDSAGVLKQNLRLVCVKIVSPPPRGLHPLKKRGKHKAYERGEPLEQEVWLLTDLLDAPAESIALLYAYRWQIELFFRWIKCTLGCRHMLAESENGVRLVLYTAFIASLLVLLWTECKPNKEVLQYIQLYMQGWADEEELMDCLARMKKR